MSATPTLLATHLQKGRKQMVSGGHRRGAGITGVGERTPLPPALLTRGPAATAPHHHKHCSPSAAAPRHWQTAAAGVC